MNTPLEAFTTTKATLLPLCHIPNHILLPFYESFQTTISAIQPHTREIKRQYLIRKFFDRLQTPPLRFQLAMANTHRITPGTMSSLVDQHQPPFSPRELITNLFSTLNPPTHNDLTLLYTQHHEAYANAQSFKTTTPTFHPSLCSYVTVATAFPTTTSLPPAPIVSMTNHWAAIFPQMTQYLIFTMSYVSLQTISLDLLPTYILTLLHHHFSTQKQLKDATTYNRRVAYPHSPLLYRFIIVYDDVCAPNNNGEGGSSEGELQPNSSSTHTLHHTIESILLQYLKPHQFIILPQSLYTSPVLYYRGRLTLQEQLSYSGQMNTFFAQTAGRYLERLSYIVFSLAILMQCYLPSNQLISRLLDIDEDGSGSKSDAKNASKSSSSSTAASSSNTTATTTTAASSTTQSLAVANNAQNEQFIGNNDNDNLFDWSDNEDNGPQPLVATSATATTTTNAKDNNQKQDSTAFTPRPSNLPKSQPAEVGCLLRLHTAINIELQRLDIQQQQQQQRQRTSHPPTPTNPNTGDVLSRFSRNNSHHSGSNVNMNAKVGNGGRGGGTGPKPTTPTHNNNHPSSFGPHTPYQRSSPPIFKCYCEAHTIYTTPKPTTPKPTTTTTTTTLTDPTATSLPPPTSATLTLAQNPYIISIHASPKLQTLINAHNKHNPSNPNNPNPTTTKPTTKPSPTTTTLHPTYSSSSTISTAPPSSAVTIMLFTPHEVQYYNHYQSNLVKTLNTQNEEHTFSLENALNHRRQQRLKQGFFSRFINKSKYKEIEFISIPNLAFLDRIGFAQFPPFHIPLLEPRSSLFLSKSNKPQFTLEQTPIILNVGPNNKNKGHHHHHHRPNHYYHHDDLFDLIQSGSVLSIHDNQLVAYQQGQNIHTIPPPVALNGKEKDNKANKKDEGKDKDKDKHQQQQVTFGTTFDITPLEPESSMQHFAHHKARLFKHMADLFMLANLPLDAYTLLKAAQESIQKEKETLQDHLFLGAMAHSKAVCTLLLDISRGHFPLGFVQFERLFFQLIHVNQLVQGMMMSGDQIINEKVKEIQHKLGYVRHLIKSTGNHTYSLDWGDSGGGGVVSDQHENGVKWEKLDHVLALMSSSSSSTTMIDNNTSLPSSLTAFTSTIIDATATTLAQPLIGYQFNTTLLPPSHLEQPHDQNVTNPPNPASQSPHHPTPLNLISLTPSLTQSNILVPTEDVIPPSPIDWTPLFEILTEIQRLPTTTNYYLALVRYEFMQHFKTAQSILGLGTEVLPIPFGGNGVPTFPKPSSSSSQSPWPPLPLPNSSSTASATSISSIISQPITPPVLPTALLINLANRLAQMAQSYTPRLSYNSYQPTSIWSSKFPTSIGATLGLGQIAQSQDNDGLVHIIDHIMPINTASPFRKLPHLPVPLIGQSGLYGISESTLVTLLGGINSFPPTATTTPASSTSSQFPTPLQNSPLPHNHIPQNNSPHHLNSSTPLSNAYGINPNAEYSAQLISLMPMFTTSHLPIERRYFDELYIAYINHQQQLFTSEQSQPNEQQPQQQQQHPITPITDTSTLLPYSDSLLITNPTLPQSRSTFSNYMANLRNNAQIANIGTIGNDREKSLLSNQFPKLFAQFYLTNHPRPSISSNLSLNTMTYDELLQNTLKLAFFSPPNFLAYLSPPQPQSQQQHQLPPLQSLVADKDREKLTILTPFEIIRVLYGQSHTDLYRHFSEAYYGFTRHGLQRRGPFTLTLQTHVLAAYFSSELNNALSLSPLRLITPTLYLSPDSLASIIAPRLAYLQMKSWIGSLNWYNQQPISFTATEKDTTPPNYLHPLFDLTRTMWGLILQYATVHNNPSRGLGKGGVGSNSSFTAHDMIRNNTNPYTPFCDPPSNTAPTTNTNQTNTNSKDGKGDVDKDGNNKDGNNKDKDGNTTKEEKKEKKDDKPDEQPFASVVIAFPPAFSHAGQPYFIPTHIMALSQLSTQFQQSQSQFFEKIQNIVVINHQATTTAPPPDALSPTIFYQLTQPYSSFFLPHPDANKISNQQRKMSQQQQPQQQQNHHQPIDENIVINTINNNTNLVLYDENITEHEDEIQPLHHHHLTGVGDNNIPRIPSHCNMSLLPVGNALILPSPSQTKTNFDFIYSLLSSTTDPLFYMFSVVNLINMTIVPFLQKRAALTILGKRTPINFNHTSLAHSLPPRLSQAQSITLPNLPHLYMNPTSSLMIEASYLRSAGSLHQQQLISNLDPDFHRKLPSISLHLANSILLDNDLNSVVQRRKIILGAGQGRVNPEDVITPYIITKPPATNPITGVGGGKVGNFFPPTNTTIQQQRQLQSTQFFRSVSNSTLSTMFTTLNLATRLGCYNLSREIAQTLLKYTGVVQFPNWSPNNNIVFQDKLPPPNFITNLAPTQLLFNHPEPSPFPAAESTNGNNIRTPNTPHQLQQEQQRSGEILHKAQIVFSQITQIDPHNFQRPPTSTTTASKQYNTISRVIFAPSLGPNRNQVHQAHHTPLQRRLLFHLLSLSLLPGPNSSSTSIAIYIFQAALLSPNTPYSKKIQTVIMSMIKRSTQPLFIQYPAFAHLLLSRSSENTSLPDLVPGSLSFPTHYPTINSNTDPSPFSTQAPPYPATIFQAQSLDNNQPYFYLNQPIPQQDPASGDINQPFAPSIWSHTTFSPIPAGYKTTALVDLVFNPRMDGGGAFPPQNQQEQRHQSQDNFISPGTTAVTATSYQHTGSQSTISSMRTMTQFNSPMKSPQMDLNNNSNNVNNTSSAPGQTIINSAIQLFRGAQRRFHTQAGISAIQNGNPYYQQQQDHNNKPPSQPILTDTPFNYIGMSKLQQLFASAIAPPQGPFQVFGTCIDIENTKVLGSFHPQHYAGFENTYSHYVFSVLFARRRERLEQIRARLKYQDQQQSQVEPQSGTIATTSQKKGTLARTTLTSFRNFPTTSSFSGAIPPHHSNQSNSLLEDDDIINHPQQQLQHHQQHQQPHSLQSTTRPTNHIYSSSSQDLFQLGIIANNRTDTTLLDNQFNINNSHRQHQQILPVDLQLIDDSQSPSRSGPSTLEDREDDEEETTDSEPELFVPDSLNHLVQFDIGKINTGTKPSDLVTFVDDKNGQNKREQTQLSQAVSTITALSPIVIQSPLPKAQTEQLDLRFSYIPLTNHSNNSIDSVSSDRQNVLTHSDVLISLQPWLLGRQIARHPQYPNYFILQPIHPEFTTVGKKFDQNSAFPFVVAEHEVITMVLRGLLIAQRISPNYIHDLAQLPTTIAAAMTNDIKTSIYGIIMSTMANFQFPQQQSQQGLIPISTTMIYFDLLRQLLFTIQPDTTFIPFVSSQRLTALVNQINTGLRQQQQQQQQHQQQSPKHHHSSSPPTPALPPPPVPTQSLPPPISPNAKLQSFSDTISLLPTHPAQSFLPINTSLTISVDLVNPTNLGFTIQPIYLHSARVDNYLLNPDATVHHFNLISGDSYLPPRSKIKLPITFVPSSSLLEVFSQSATNPSSFSPSHWPVVNPSLTKSIIQIATISFIVDGMITAIPFRTFPFQPQPATNSTGGTGTVTGMTNSQPIFGPQSNPQPETFDEWFSTLHNGEYQHHPSHIPFPSYIPPQFNLHAIPSQPDSTPPGSLWPITADQPLASPINSNLIHFAYNPDSTTPAIGNDLIIPNQNGKPSFLTNYKAINDISTKMNRKSDVTPLPYKPKPTLFDNQLPPRQRPFHTESYAVQIIPPLLKTSIVGQLVPDLALIGQQINLSFDLQNISQSIYSIHDVTDNQPRQVLESLLALNQIKITLYGRPKTKDVHQYDFHTLPRPISTTHYSSLTIGMDQCLDHDSQCGDDSDHNGQSESPPPQSRPQPLAPEDNAGWAVLRHGIDYELDLDQVMMSLPLKQHQSTVLELFLTPTFTLETIPTLLRRPKTYLERFLIDPCDRGDSVGQGGYQQTDVQFPTQQQYPSSRPSSSAYQIPVRNDALLRNPLTSKSTSIEFEFYLDIQYSSQTPQLCERYHKYTQFQTSFKWYTTFKPAIVIDEIVQTDDTIVAHLEEEEQQHGDENGNEQFFATFIATISNNSDFPIILNSTEKSSLIQTQLDIFGPNHGATGKTTFATPIQFPLDPIILLPPQSTSNIIIRYPFLTFDDPTFDQNLFSNSLTTTSPSGDDMNVVGVRDNPDQILFSSPLLSLVHYISSHLSDSPSSSTSNPYDDNHNNNHNNTAVFRAILDEIYGRWFSKLLGHLTSLSATAIGSYRSQSTAESIGGNLALMVDTALLNPASTLPNTTPILPVVNPMAILNTMRPDHWLEQLPPLCWIRSVVATPVYYNNNNNGHSYHYNNQHYQQHYQTSPATTPIPQNWSVSFSFTSHLDLNHWLAAFSANQVLFNHNNHNTGDPYNQNDDNHPDSTQFQIKITLSRPDPSPSPTNPAILTTIAAPLSMLLTNSTPQSPSHHNNHSPFSTSPNSPNTTVPISIQLPPIPLELCSLTHKNNNNNNDTHPPPPSPSFYSPNLNYNNHHYDQHNNHNPYQQSHQNTTSILLTLEVEISYQSLILSSTTTTIPL